MATADRIMGAAGTVEGTAEAAVTATSLMPRAFAAATLMLYATPLARPVMVQPLAVPAAVQERLPGMAVAL
jgi:hypothetical protein